MTTIISRLYESVDMANEVAGQLHAEGFPGHLVGVISQTGDASAMERMLEARLDEETAQAYAQHMSAGRGLLIVHAPFNPVGAALRAMQIVDGRASIDAGAPSPNRYIAGQPMRKTKSSILKDHRRFLTPDIKPGERRRGPISNAFGMRLLSTKSRGTGSIMKGGKFMSAAFIPFPLLSTKERSKSAGKSGHPLSNFFMLPLLSSKS